MISFVPLPPQPVGGVRSDHQWKGGARAQALTLSAALVVQERVVPTDVVSQAIEIREEKLKPDHPDLTELLTEFAGLLRAVGREDEAMELDRRVKEAGKGSD